MKKQKNKDAENEPVQNLNPEILYENPTVQNLLKFMEPDSPYFVTIRISDPENPEDTQLYFL